MLRCESAGMLAVEPNRRGEHGEQGYNCTKISDHMVPTSRWKLFKI